MLLIATLFGASLIEMPRRYEHCREEHPALALSISSCVRKTDNSSLNIEIAMNCQGRNAETGQRVLRLLLAELPVIACIPDDTPERPRLIVRRHRGSCLLNRAP